MGTFGLLLIIQAQVASAAASSQAVPVEVSSVRATRAAEPPVLDGSDEDAVWRGAPAIDRFLQAKPSEGAPARYATVARVAYDPAQSLHLRPRLRSPSRQHRQPARPPRRADRVRRDHRDARLLARPAHRLRVRGEPGRGEVRLRHLQRRQRGRRLGCGLGCGDPDRLARLDRRVPDPALAAQLLRQRQHELRLAGLAHHPAPRRVASPGRSIVPRAPASPRSSARSPGWRGWRAPTARRSSPTCSPGTSRARRPTATRATRTSPSAATSSTGSPPTSCSTPPSTPTSARSRPIPRCSTSARSRPSSRSGGPSSWRARDCSPSR